MTQNRKKNGEFDEYAEVYHNVYNTQGKRLEI